MGGLSVEGGSVGGDSVEGGSVGGERVGGSVEGWSQGEWCPTRASSKLAEACIAGHTHPPLPSAPCPCPGLCPGHLGGVPMLDMPQGEGGQDEEQLTGTAVRPTAVGRRASLGAEAVTGEKHGAGAGAGGGDGCTDGVPLEQARGRGRGRGAEWGRRQRLEGTLEADWWAPREQRGGGRGWGREGREGEGGREWRGWRVGDDVARSTEGGRRECEGEEREEVCKEAEPREEE